MAPCSSCPSRVTAHRYFKDKGAGRKGVIVLLPTTSVRHSEPVTGSSRHLTLPASSSVRLATAQLALKSDDPCVLCAP